MSGRRFLRRFSSSISDLLSIQRRETIDEIERSTPLHDAVQMGNLIMTTHFVETKSVFIDEEDSKGRTALHYAMEQNDIEIASVLLKSGANVDSVDYDGESPCHIACRLGMIDHFNLLLYYHVNIGAIDKSGRTPFDMACEFGHKKLLDRLLNCGIGDSCFMNAGNMHSASALHLAARNGHVQIVSLLLERGWDINRLTNYGSALHIAVGFGKTQVVRLLLKSGIDTMLTNIDGQTAYEFSKRNPTRNPITYKEIRFLLKHCSNFVNATAISEHFGIKADELSFSVGDRIWVIEQNERGHWKGIVFGQKGNSRSGYFDAKSVQIEKRAAESMSSATSHRLSISPSLPMTNGRNSAKPVPMPVVPPSTNAFYLSKRNDLNRSSSSMMSSFGRAPSGMSDGSSDSNNGNRRGHSMTQSTFSSYGTDVATMLAGNRMTASNQQLNGQPSSSLSSSSSMFPSTSVLPLQQFSPTAANAATTHTHTNANVDDFHHRVSTGSNSSYGSSGFESMKNSMLNDTSSDNTPCRASLHSTGSGSGSSSLASSSVQTLDDSFHSASTAAQTPTVVNVTQLVLNGVPQAEILANWLDSLNMTEYLSTFLKQGYDLYSISRCTPEDLLSLGIKKPEHRKKLIAEIHGWQIQDNWPHIIPIGGLREWLHSIALAEYIPIFENQGYTTVQDVLSLTWEDFEDIGVKRLGHLKRFGLAIKKIKDYSRANGSTIRQTPNTPSSSNSSPFSNIAEARSIASRMNDPPPPAPSSNNFHPRMGVNSKIDYISYTRGVGGGGAKPAPPIRQISGSENRCRNMMTSSYDTLFSDDEPIRLNLVSTGKILSEISKVGNDKLGDGSGNESSGECPPPPAPLYCDVNPMRLFPLRTSICSSGSASSSEMMPFANENCGTIRAARDSNKFDVPSCLPPLISENSESTDPMDATSAYQEIDDMMKNLVGELDTMILSSKSNPKKSALKKPELKS